MAGLVQLVFENVLALLAVSALVAEAEHTSLHLQLEVFNRFPAFRVVTDNIYNDVFARAQLILFKRDGVDTLSRSDADKPADFEAEHFLDLLNGLSL